mmetsp:Transcript_56649/g.120291  ORF Transcript_56649/g.120291 Transcript_56649/m.120291 type:complete len:205 (-) Transcript_56649:1296-1910(-)
MKNDFPHRFISRSCIEVLRPMSAARRLMIVGGSWRGSPTASIRLGRRWKGMQISGSVAAAASSISRSSILRVRLSADDPAVLSVQKMTRAVASSSGTGDSIPSRASARSSARPTASSRRDARASRSFAAAAVALSPSSSSSAPSRIDLWLGMLHTTLVLTLSARATNESSVASRVSSNVRRSERRPLISSDSDAHSSLNDSVHV